MSKGTRRGAWSGLTRHRFAWKAIPSRVTGANGALKPPSPSIRRGGGCLPYTSHTAIRRGVAARLLGGAVQVAQRGVRNTRWVDVQRRRRVGLKAFDERLRRQRPASRRAGLDARGLVDAKRYGLLYPSSQGRQTTSRRAHEPLGPWPGSSARSSGSSGGSTRTSGTLTSQGVPHSGQAIVKRTGSIQAWRRVHTEHVGQRRNTNACSHAESPVPTSFAADAHGRMKLWISCDQDWLRGPSTR